MVLIGSGRRQAFVACIGLAWTEIFPRAVLDECLLHTDLIGTSDWSVDLDLDLDLNLDLYLTWTWTRTWIWKDTRWTLVRQRQPLIAQATRQ